MIIVSFNGGLGNQMLQFASYVALQERYPSIRVVADIRKYNISRIHNGLELEGPFPIRLNVLLGKKANKVSSIGRFWHFALNKVVIMFFNIGLSKYCFVKDDGVFKEHLFHLNINKNYYLDGEWGNEKYFTNAKELIKEYFTFKKPLDTLNERIADKIRSQNSLSVHIRRGDYLSSGSSFVDLSKSDYYPDAFNYLTKAVINPVFFIFSDDIEWCRINLKWLKEYEHYFVKGNDGMGSYKDLQLMSLCKHNVIANSTFSWWGGWLNSNPNRIVICPKKLFYDEKLNDKILAEFYPETWVKI